MSDTTHTIDLAAANSPDEQYGDQHLKRRNLHQEGHLSSASSTRDPSPDPKEGRRGKDDRSGTSAYPNFTGDLPWSQRSWLYELKPFRGMYYDFRRRLPFLASDWTTAFQPKNWWTVAQYIPRMYFINLMPAISYIIDMNHRTGGAYGLNEVILASALAAIVFPVFSIQPLTFVGVTGLINLVNYTQYDIVVGYYGLDRLDYLRVQAWSLIWAAAFHFVVSIFNVCDFTRFITDMTSSTFGFYVGIVYIQKGIELLLLEFEPAPLDNSTGWLSVTIAILFTVSVYLVTAIGKTSFLPFKIRYFVSSFAFAVGCIFWTGFSHFPKNSLNNVPIERLPITRSFYPSIDRPWFIDFWNIEARWIGVGAPFGFLIMILFYFDHNVSSVMAQARQFPVKRPAGFHWDFFLLGITTLISGFLGLPAPNGLVPQCPWSTEALSVYKQVDVAGSDEEMTPLQNGSKEKRSGYAKHHVIISRVVENRLGHLIVGLLTLGTMTRPLLVVLGTMPRALFAGIFILVGWSSIESNIITTRTLAVIQDRHMTMDGNPLNKLPRKKIALFVGIQWLFFAMTIAISQTIAAIGFPIIITLLIPFRYYVVPKWFTPAELRILDAPTADADVVLASIGQETEAVTGQGQKVARDTGIAGTEWSDDEDRKSDDDDDDDDEGQYIHTRRAAAPISEAAGYIIKGDDDDEVVDYREKDVLPTDQIAHSADMGGGLHSVYSSQQAIVPPMTGAPSSSFLFGTPLGATMSNKSSNSSTASPQKNNKRTKSATTGWWSVDENQPVERAPTPVKPTESEKVSAPAVETIADSPTPAAVGASQSSQIKDLPREEPKEGAGLLKRLFSSRGNRKKVPSYDQKEQQAPSSAPITSSKANGKVAVPASPTSVAALDLQKAVDEHMAQHFGATKVDNKEPGLVAITQSTKTTGLGDAPEAGPSTSVAAGPSKDTDQVRAAPALSAKETLVDPPLEEQAASSNVPADPAASALSSTPVAVAAPTAPATRESAIPVRDSSKPDPTAVIAAEEDSITTRRKEAAAAAAETMAIAEANKQKGKTSKDIESRRREEEKRKAKAGMEAAKKREKEEAKLRKVEAKRQKEEAALQKKRDKAAALKKKSDEKEAKEKEIRMAAEAKRRNEAEKRRAAIGVKSKALAKEKETKEAALAAVVASTAAAKKEAEDAEKLRLEQQKSADAELSALAAKRKAEEKALQAAAAENDALNDDTTALAKEKQTLESDVALLQAGKMNVLTDFEIAEKAKKEEAEKIRLQQENDFALMQAGKMNLLSEFEAAEKARQEQSAAKQAEEEAALMKLSQEKGKMKEDLALIQAGKEKELADFKEMEAALEKERIERVKKEEAELAAKREQEEIERAEQLKKEEAERLDRLRKEEAEHIEKLRAEEAARAEQLRKEEAEREEQLKKEEAEREEALKKEEAERLEAVKRQEAERAEKARIEEKERAEKIEAEEKARAEQVQKEKQEQKKKHEEEAAALAALVASREAAKREVSAVKENKEAETAEVARLREEKERLEEETLQTKKKADEEVARLAKEKEDLEKKTAETKKEEEAALALLLSKQEKAKKDADAVKEKAETDAAERLKKEEADAADRKKKEEEALALLVSKQEAAKKEADAIKEKADTDASERKIKEEADAADRKKREEAALALLVSKQEAEKKDLAALKAKEETEAAERKKAEEKAMAEIAAKKAALQKEVEALEAKARAERLFQAPVKVAKSDLKVMVGQVAGHDDTLYSLSHGALAVKTSSLSESSFYQNVLIHHTATTRKNQADLLARLAKYLPTYHGTIDLTSGGAAAEEQTNLAVIMENLTKKYKHANVLDIKLGKQLWDESATAEKKKRMEEASRSSTSYLTGMRLTGWQVWDNKTKQYIKVGKKYGKTIRANQIPIGLRHFFGLASNEDATSITEIGGDSVSAIALPEKTMERVLHDGVIPSVKEIIDIVKKLEWRVRGGSLLIVYEGDATELAKITTKSDLTAGRRLTDTDQLVDTHNIKDVIVHESASRLVDVRLIDFAHATFGKEKGHDEGYLAGLETIKHQLDDLYKALHKGTLKNKDNTRPEDAAKKSNGGFFSGLFRSSSYKKEIKSNPNVVAAPMPATPAKKEIKEKDTTTKAVTPLASKEDATKKSEMKEVSPIEKTPTKKRKSVDRKAFDVAPVAVATEKAAEKKVSDSTTTAEPYTPIKPSDKTVEPKYVDRKSGDYRSLDRNQIDEKLAKEGKTGSLGILDLFKTGLVDNSRRNSKELHPKAKGESFEEIRKSMDGKQDKSLSMTKVKEPSIKSNKSKGKGKGKAKAVEETAAPIVPAAGSDSKLESFWQVKEKEKETAAKSEGKHSMEAVGEDTLVDSSAKSTGPRKIIRHENPRRGAGKPPPAIQFRTPGEL